MVYLKNVSTVYLDEKSCVGCGMCTLVCPHAVLELDRNKARIARRDLCMECGACATNCPADAISVRRGVGCAAAVINSMLGRKGDACCCLADPDDCDRGGS